MQRTISIVLGIFVALAGVVALGYALDGISFMRFSRGQILGDLVGVAVPGVLCASAFYMAYKLIFKPKPR